MRVTAFYASLLAFLYLALAVRVIRARLRGQVDMGHDGDRLLERYVRSHGNFAEYVPMGLVLLVILEASGTAPWLLHLLGLMLLVGRAAHAWSFSTVELRLPSRTLGMGLSMAMIGLAALLALARALGL